MEKEFDLEGKITASEASEKINPEAVAKAKENIAKKKLDDDAREVERRLSSAERIEKEELLKLRLSRRKADAQKKYLAGLSAAKAAFETSGDYKAYDTAVAKLDTDRDNEIGSAKRDIYGDDSWRY